MDVLVKDNKVVVSFQYDPDVVQKIKQIPGRKWDSGKKVWTLPAEQLVTLQATFPDARYQIQETDPNKVGVDVFSTHASIYSSEQSVYELAEALCTYAIKDAKYSEKYRSGQWNGSMCLYHRVSNIFPLGLLNNLAQALEKKGYQVTISDTRAKPMGQSQATSIVLRPYQEKAYQAWKDNNKQGIIAISPGLGKTEIAIQAIADLNVRTLFLVHTQDLAMQAVERLEKHLGKKVGFIGGGEFELRKVTVGMMQTFYQGLESTQLVQLLRECELLVADEAHHYSATTFHAVMQKVGAPYRMGLTATPYRESGDAIVFESQLGKVVYGMNLKDGVEQGWLCHPTFIFHEVQDCSRKVYDYSDDYSLNIVNNKQRNELIAELALTSIREGQSVLVLVSQIDHGTYLQERIPDSVFLNGQLKKEQRAKSTEAFRQEKIKCIIATSIFDEGVDVPQIDVLINAVAQKSRGKYIQRIGRAMRINKDSNHCEIHDFIDGGIHTASHSEMRMHTIREEGFEVVVL